MGKRWSRAHITTASRSKATHLAATMLADAHSHTHHTSRHLFLSEISSLPMISESLTSDLQNRSEHAPATPNTFECCCLHRTASELSFSMAFDSSSAAADDSGILLPPSSNDSTSLSALRKELFEVARSPRRVRNVQVAAGLWECGQQWTCDCGCEDSTRPVDIPVELEQQLPNLPLEMQISRMMTVAPMHSTTTGTG